MTKAIALALLVVACTPKEEHTVKSNVELNRENDRKMEHDLKMIELDMRHKLLDMELRKMGLDSAGNPTDTTKR